MCGVPDGSLLSDREQVADALRLLCDLDWLAVSSRDTGGRRATVYQVNPRGARAMSYLDRLKAQFLEKVSTLPTAKTAKSPYDSFDSAQGRHFLETEAALSAGVATPRNLGSDGTPLSAAALAIQRETSDPGALWWRIAILEPGGRTVEVDTPSGWTLGEWQAYAARYHGDGCAVTPLVALPKPRAPVNLDEALGAACEGVAGITVEVFRSLLWSEDIKDIEAGGIPVETLRVYAESFAVGMRSRRIVVPGGEP